MQPDPLGLVSSPEEANEIFEKIDSSLKETETQIRFSKQLSDQAVKITADKLKKATKLQKFVEDVHQSDQVLRDIQGALAAIQMKTKAINAIVMKLQLLSFNASIEASRAAQYGKGFSVVAEEVGRLAQTSGLAAREIETLVDSCHEQTNKGLGTIIEKTSKSVTACRELLSGLSDVSTCVDGVAAALIQVDQLTQSQALEIERMVLQQKRHVSAPAPMSPQNKRPLAKPKVEEENAPVIDIQSLSADDPSFKTQD